MISSLNTESEVLASLNVAQALLVTLHKKGILSDQEGDRSPERGVPVDGQLPLRGDQGRGRHRRDHEGRGLGPLNAVYCSAL